mgnify:FL=1
MNKGLDEQEAIKMARSRMPGTYEYFRIFKCMSDQQSKIEVKNFQDARKNTLDNFIKRHGDELGRKRFDEYRQKQAYSNSFEYKSKHKGWSLQEFDAYNASRAATKANFVKRHGSKRGSKMWDRYIERQKYAGVSEQYFIEKYGETEGKSFYKKLNQLKSHSYQSFLMKADGDVTLADKLYNAFYQNRVKSKLYWSAISQRLFEQVHQHLPAEFNVYYGSHGSEFPLFKTGHKIIFVDFYVQQTKKAIEFNGDYWHANPVFYKSCDLINFPGNRRVVAQDVWNADSTRMKYIRQHPCVDDCMIVWEHDFVSQPHLIIEKCVKFILNENN